MDLNNNSITVDDVNNNVKQEQQQQQLLPPTEINATGIIEERVKVDRKRFEQMLGENSLIGCDADSFFNHIMKSTNTQIMWPPKLKPGTKSKKDPHVRITGSPNSISAAKEIIFEQLDTRRNRVTLKMDVAFTDHSHIIGKGGRSIQRVMDETGCHIHFPDSNRTNTAEKSNQVSIAGSAEGVEQSRCRIREMLPITLQFDLPLNNGLHSPPTLDPQSPQLQAIQQSYGITITFRCDGTKCIENSYFASSRIVNVSVRGAKSHLFGLRQGLSLLIEYLTGFRANVINVPLVLTIDVAVQHHQFIAGRGNCNLISIMQSTGAIITMPDPDRKTTISVKGSSFDIVYNAWQELIGYLPLILIFDLKEGQDLDPIEVTRLTEQMRQISIIIKPKQRQNTKSVVVRGPEKDSRLLFAVRKQLLNLDELTTQDPQQQVKQELQQQQTQQLSITSPSISQANNNHELQMKAIKAILDPNLQKTRQPTPYWAGLGFSKSVSEPMIKEKLGVGPSYHSNLVDERRISYSNEGFTGVASTSGLNSLRSSKISSCLRLAVFLGRIGLAQYLELFTRHSIDLEMLFNLNENDFAILGMPYVHRRKLAIAIAEVKSNIQGEQRSGGGGSGLSTFDAAPGAERSRRQKSSNGSIQGDIWSM